MQSGAFPDFESVIMHMYLLLLIFKYMVSCNMILDIPCMLYTKMQVVNMFRF